MADLPKPSAGSLKSNFQGRSSQTCKNDPRIYMESQKAKHSQSNPRQQQQNVLEVLLYLTSSYAAEPYNQTV